MLIPDPFNVIREAIAPGCTKDVLPLGEICSTQQLAALAALWQIEKATREVVVLEHDPARTSEQNAELKRRAEAFRAAARVVVPPHDSQEGQT